MGTLLSGPTQAWFAPLVEDFPAFLAELEATFGETDQQRIALNKIYALEQGLHAASVYASEFRQLACDVNWDDQALVDHFRRGLRINVKNLLLNFPKPTSLSQAISQAVHCDNRLFNFAKKSAGLGFHLIHFHDTPRSYNPRYPSHRLHHTPLLWEMLLSPWKLIKPDFGH